MSLSNCFQRKKMSTWLLWKYCNSYQGPNREAAHSQGEDCCGFYTKNGRRRFHARKALWSKESWLSDLLSVFQLFINWIQRDRIRGLQTPGWPGLTQNHPLGVMKQLHLCTPFRRTHRHTLTRSNTHESERKECGSGGIRAAGGVGISQCCMTNAANARPDSRLVLRALKCCGKTRELSGGGWKSYFSAPSVHFRHTFSFHPPRKVSLARP